MTELEKLKMDDEYITQNDIVKRYLHNKLTPEETVEFEEYLLDKPELLERLELDMVLVETLSKVNLTKQQNNEEEGALKPSYLNVIFGIPARVGLGTIIGCVIVMLVLTNNDKSSLVINPTIEYLSPYRSALLSEQGNVISRKSESTVLVLQPAEISNESYMLTITHSSGREVFSADSVEQNPQGDVILSFSIHEFELGEYSVKLLSKDNSVKFEESFIINN